MAKALITGASSGMGRDMAIILSKMGYDIVLAARNEEKLKETAEKIDTEVTIIPIDLSIRKNCFRLYREVRDIDILINNAGFGQWGEFCKSDLKEELNMINLNICALHVLTKLYLRDFVKRNKGYILNVSSLAAFGAGPLMAAYYATKSYVYKLTTAINEELRVRRSKVGISVFCPGPVDTGFNKRAGVSFSVKALHSMEASKIAVNGMFARKMVIVPTVKEKIVALMSGVAPLRLVLIVCYKIQCSKGKGKESK